MLKKLSVLFIVVFMVIISTGCFDISNTVSDTVEYLVNFVAVDESNNPIEGAVIILDGDSKTTNVSGVTSFNKPNGTYNYTINCDGYEEFADSITVSDSDTTENVTLIEETTIIFEEDFTGVNIDTSSWSTSDSDYWSIENTDFAGGLSPEAYFDCRNNSDIISQLFSPEVDASAYSKELIISFKQNIDPYELTGDFSLSLKYKIKGTSNWIELWFEVPIADDVGSKTITVDATNDLSEEIFELAWVFEGTGWKLYYWYIDDIVITAK